MAEPTPDVKQEIAELKRKVLADYRGGLRVITYLIGERSGLLIALAWMSETSHKDGTNATDLHARTGVSLETVKTWLKRMDQAGYVQRRPKQDEEDAFFLTEAQRRVLVRKDDFPNTDSRLQNLGRHIYRALEAYQEDEGGDGIYQEDEGGDDDYIGR